ncbi:hypothetical protein GOM49_12810 [Clostridium bovifaecis]|uniref:BIG2 domain-containing protein n=1 Tax=Clostridium bovifaecis TaxID=2184719 RepID=A0A6I6F034_9CLOT|nr:hypothetical protein GOM49_12810 [Clostridium bovifaecis]
MNKNKLGKVTGVATAAFLIAGTTAFTAFAAMPTGTAVIGDKAFDLNYLNDPANVDEITAAMQAANFKVYVKGFDGAWIDNATETELKDLAAIPAVEYKNAKGEVTKYDAKDGDVTVEGLKVASVSAINNTTVEVNVSGSLTDKTITAADFKVAVEGSEVQIAKFEAGSTVGTYRLTIGTILSNGETITVTGADDLDGSVTTKYAAYKVTSVEGVAATVDSTKTEQQLGLKANGAATTVEALDAEGYEVQFQATENVFNGATVSGNGILDKTDLDTLVTTNGKNNFKYKVVITKDGAIVAESAQVEVKVYDGSKTASGIKEFTLNQVLGTEKITSGKLVVGESATIEDIIASSLVDSRQDIDITQDVEVESSNPFVVSVAQPVAPTTPATITANGTGTATITIKSGNTSKTFTVTVVSEARKITSVATSDSSIKLARNGVKDITLTFKDQYGDVIASAADGTDYTVSANVQNADANTIATLAVDVAADDTSATGKETVTFTAHSSNTGSGTFRVYKPNGAVMLSIPVTVEADTIAKTYKLEAANSSSVDKILDLNDEEITESNDGNDEIVFNLNQYTNAGSFIGKVSGASSLVYSGATAGNFNVQVVDSKGAVTATADGDGDTADLVLDDVNGTITIAPEAFATRDFSKTGTYTLKVTNSTGTLVASTTFTVKDTAPVISSANFVTGFEINATSTDIKSLIPDANIKVTGAGGDGKVRVDANGIVYIDTNNSDAGNTSADDAFEAGIDIYLGQIVAAKKSGTVTTPTIGTSTLTVATDDDGVVTIGITKRGASTPAFTGNFTVKVD